MGILNDEVNRIHRGMAKIADKYFGEGEKMDNKGKKVLEEAGLLYPAPNCVEYYQVVKATADEVAQRIFEAMSDTVQVVRCKDCIHHTYWCEELETRTNPDDYCSWGERREDAVAK